MEIDTKMFFDGTRAWPGSALCLKRRAPKGVPSFTGYTQFGVVTSARAPITIYLRGKDPKDDFKETVEFGSLDEMLRAGWEVD